MQQRPDERIMWNVSQGVQHSGVVTFHELADRLTRIQASLDVEPGSLIEKAARGMRHVKRAVRARPRPRLKAFVEMQEVEPGAWRGVIADGEVKKEHPSSYDKGRDYADFEDIHDREPLSLSPQTTFPVARRLGRRTAGDSGRRTFRGIEAEEQRHFGARSFDRLEPQAQRLVVGALVLGVGVPGPAAVPDSGRQKATARS